MQHCNSASSRDSADSDDCNLLRCRSLDNFGMGTLARTYALESLQTIRRVMPLLNIHFWPVGTPKGPDKAAGFHLLGASSRLPAARRARDGCFLPSSRELVGATASCRPYR